MVGRSAAWQRIQVALCEELGLDPTKLTKMEVCLEPHGLTTATYTGVQRIEPDQLRRALAAAETPDDPDD